MRKKGGSGSKMVNVGIQYMVLDSGGRGLFAARDSMKFSDVFVAAHCQLTLYESVPQYLGAW